MPYFNSMIVDPNVPTSYSQLINNNQYVTYVKVVVDFGLTSSPTSVGLFLGGRL